MADNNIVIQYPATALETIVDPSKQINPINQLINRKLIYITVSLPEGGILIIKNNNIQCLYFVGECHLSIPMPDGMWIENLSVTMNNTSTTAGRFNLNMVFE